MRRAQRSRSVILVLVGAISLGALGACSSDRPHKTRPHLDLEMTGEEYKKQLAESGSDAVALQSPKLRPALTLGERNLEWLKLINSKRSQPISFSSRETQVGYPIDAPKEYNPDLIFAAYQNLEKTMPQALGQILFSQVPLPETLPVDEKTYIKWGRDADRVYQSAARWLMMEPYLDALRAHQYEDIRGFYFLTRLEEREKKFANFQGLSPNEQKEIKGWLTLLCMNARLARKGCAQGVDGAVQKNSLEKFYQGYLKHGQRIWDGLMTIQPRQRFRDVRWIDDKNVRVPFRPVQDPAIADFLRVNLEDEWKFPGFQLYVDFNLKSADAVFVTWEPGVTPHVPYLGASEMVMDANAPITEYDVQWTIRHEFGHVLGLPDCYVEFYSDATQSIISYQIDTTDLMCSRRGAIKERHVEELKRAYAK